MPHYKFKNMPDIWFSKTSREMPSMEIGAMSVRTIASYAGLDHGFAIIEYEANKNVTEVAGAHRWNVKHPKAYGISLSLYDQHPITKKTAGDPNADSFAIYARENNAFIGIADGVNWGKKAQLAGRSALLGSLKHLNTEIFSKDKFPKTTQEMFVELLKSFKAAHEMILDKSGGLTTLCVAAVVPLKTSFKYALCAVNVGDSYAYIYSKYDGLWEATLGSHDVYSEHDMRDTGGALGPVKGKNPELHNLTCSLTLVNPGDIVYLTTDGISDNFDPVVKKIARPKREGASASDAEFRTDEYSTGAANVDFSDLPEMAPQERHEFSLKEMERVILEHELITEEPLCAQDICAVLSQHVLVLTDPKRKVLEDPMLYKHKRAKSSEKFRYDPNIRQQMARSPGKLDHASIVAYEVGNIANERLTSPLGDPSRRQSMQIAPGHTPPPSSSMSRMYSFESSL